MVAPLYSPRAVSGSGKEGGLQIAWDVGLQGLVVVTIGGLILWAVSLTLADAGIADTFWGIGFVLLAGLYANRTNGWAIRSGLVMGLVTIWGIRLALHIHGRNRGQPEDPRYAAWRAATGPSFWWKSLFTVFILQGVLLWIISAPLLAAQSSPRPTSVTAFDMIGTAIWLVGFTFEAVGDAQLRAFKKDPANVGKVLETGLWRFTRHPNYFGDSVVWWGLYLVAAGVPGGPWTVFGPILMTVLLVRISGVPLLEKGLGRTRPGYPEYAARTSAFLPLPPKRSGPRDR